MLSFVAVIVTSTFFYKRTSGVYTHDTTHGYTRMHARQSAEVDVNHLAGPVMTDMARLAANNHRTLAIHFSHTHAVSALQPPSQGLGERYPAQGKYVKQTTTACHYHDASSHFASAGRCQHQHQALSDTNGAETELGSELRRSWSQSSHEARPTG